MQVFVNRCIEKANVKTEIYSVVKKYQCDSSCFSDKCKIKWVFLQRMNPFTFSVKFSR